MTFGDGVMFELGRAAVGIGGTLGLIVLVVLGYAFAEWVKHRRKEPRA